MDKKQVEHIAKLARMEINDREKEKFASQISSILDYVEQLQQVDTEGIEETAQVTGLVNVMRSDMVEDWGEDIKQKLIGQALDTDGRLIKTKPVF